MRKQLELVVAMVVLLLVAIPTVTEADLVGYWNFSESSGTTAFDSAGNNHGVVHGATRVDGALSFDGVDDYVEVPDAPALDLTTFTLEAQFEIDRLPDPAEAFTILSKGEDPSTDHANYYLMIVNSNAWGPYATKIACVFEDHSDYNYWLTFEIDESYVARSVHVVSTLEGNDWNMYLDRSKVAASIYLNDHDNPISLSGQVPATGNSPLFFGTFDARTSDSGGYFPGV